MQVSRLIMFRVICKLRRRMQLRNIQVCQPPPYSMLSVFAHCVLYVPIYGIKHTTVSVTNGVGVQLRGGCASDGPWFEKHRANTAAGRVIATGEFWIDRPIWRTEALESIFKNMQKRSVVVWS